ncbi:nucleoside hydrolase [Streptomyces sp. OfavH-34-F]|uniref:nucleoside hydrolase n=1 Tax=Streptomyces sp. OfavH-34-F TaxID=2917760 RepID=UPI001EF30847|nr:nucleoside hydrolase [Streptomyces sp. OfavH-34-F]MCG7523306.1 nucleoside hydrolase [Streptomyces sp. OfavH-34-F]
MREEHQESEAVLRQHWEAVTRLSRVASGTGLATIGESLRASGPWPEDVRKSPMIIDTDIGGDADDALAVAAAARRVPELAMVITGDEVDGERARFARHLLDLLGRSDVATVAGASLDNSRYYCVYGLMPDSVPSQRTDVVTAVRELCEATDGPVRWVGMAPLTNLARVLAEAPELAPRLRVTQMGGALRYRNPDSAEHNIRLDVDGARQVLNHVVSGLLPMPEFVASEVTFTPQIEVTTGSALYRGLRAAPSGSWEHLLADHLDRWFADFYPGSMQHDALTLTAALDLPFVDSAQLHVAMDAIGRTTEAPRGQGATVRWSMSAEYDAFMRWMSAALLQPVDVVSTSGADSPSP